MINKDMEWICRVTLKTTETTETETAEHKQHQVIYYRTIH